MSKLKPMSERDRKYFEVALRMVGINLNSIYALDLICDSYELVREKGGNGSIKDAAKIAHNNQQKHSILLSLVPDVYWDVD